MKKLCWLFAFLLFAAFCFGENFNFHVQLNGNAHIVSWNTMSKLHQYRKQDMIPTFSAFDLYQYFLNIGTSCAGNDLLYDQKCEEASNTLIVIYGDVAGVRRSILDEYIVELKVYDPDSFFTWDVCVVYPEQISPAMINELMQLKRGDRHSAIAFTRNTYAYVDVCVWNQNGIYRTEP